MGLLKKKMTIKHYGIVGCCLLALLFLLNTAVAGEELKKAEKNSEIRVSADKLVSDRNANYAEFIGNVVATRDGSTLTCGKLKVFYAEKGAKTENNTTDKSGAVKKMVADEKVKLVFEDKIAVADKAVYTAENDSIVLTGGDPKVKTGSSYISGDKITLFRTAGKIVVDRGETKRVNAEFHPQDEALMKKKKASGHK